MKTDFMNKKRALFFALFSLLPTILSGCYGVPKPGAVTMVFPHKKKEYEVSPKTDFLKYDYEITPEETY